MLKKQSNLEDGKSFSEEDRDEELYQRLFKKIARDFVFKEELNFILEDFYEKVLNKRKEKELTKEDINYFSEQAILKALEYRNNLSLPKRQRKKYKDVINND